MHSCDRARENWPTKIGGPSHVFDVTAGGTVELFADMRFTLKVSSFDLHFFVHPGISPITPPRLSTTPYSSLSIVPRFLRVGGWQGYGQPPNHPWRRNYIYRPDSIKPASNFQDRTRRIGSEETRAPSGTHSSDCVWRLHGGTEERPLFSGVE